ncbi:uncharacterized protein [Neodiprion pinetum]|uniref:Uncharacterized protein LOC107220317 n=1 Tax=Neodiprion lecontei TaxID=441921 RepID=A0A6J0BKS2_NEOLC|nr:uncharacterized protein LOC107220317 [Neodiprion lecontei]XP_046422973.1 uncharacterized protein LOC124180983 [Neodiprion fabricii]XP_046478387.1 uncharacterized protein LOC124217125 [Neodiprion pinetum]XP_046616746.1 uncharacterized protein LOC124303511 [Neodiprion virginianus]
MEFLSNARIVLVTLFVSSIKLTSANYCEWNTCQSWEYCCGDNMCCTNNDVVLNLTILVCAALALLLICCSMLFMCRYLCRVRHPVFQLVGIDGCFAKDAESTSNLPAFEVVNEDRIYTEPPPPYSEVTRNVK